jgi:hypothetical protein
VPFATVFGVEPWHGEMPPDYVTALSITFSEFKSNKKFNWDTFKWPD